MLGAVAALRRSPPASAGSRRCSSGSRRRCWRSSRRRWCGSAGGRSSTRFKLGLAVAAFLALALFDAPFPLVIAGGGADRRAGRRAPARLARRACGQLRRRRRSAERPRGCAAARWRRSRVWLGDLGRADGAGRRDAGHRPCAVGRSGCSSRKLAVVTFGGAYAVLGLHGAGGGRRASAGCRAGEMADGLGLAETTPGPLIMVTQFVGFLAAFRDAAPFTPLMAGVARRGADHLGHLRAVLPVDLRLRAVDGPARARPRLQGGAGGDHRGGGRRDRPARAVVRGACAVPRGSRPAGCPIWRASTGARASSRLVAAVLLFAPQARRSCSRSAVCGAAGLVLGLDSRDTSHSRIAPARPAGRRRSRSAPRRSARPAR